MNTRTPSLLGPALTQSTDPFYLYSQVVIDAAVGTVSDAATDAEWLQCKEQLLAKLKAEEEEAAAKDTALQVEAAAAEEEEAAKLEVAAEDDMAAAGQAAGAAPVAVAADGSLFFSFGSDSADSDSSSGEPCALDLARERLASQLPTAAAAGLQAQLVRMQGLLDCSSPWAQLAAAVGGAAVVDVGADGSLWFEFVVGDSNSRSGGRPQPLASQLAQDRLLPLLPPQAAAQLQRRLSGGAE